MKDKKGHCLCSTWKETQCIPMLGEIIPEKVFAEFAILKKRTPWLDLIRCKHCGRNWYIATDTVDDNFHAILLHQDAVQAILTKDIWPTNFDGCDHVWPDEGWFRVCGYKDLDDWREKEGF